VHDPADELEGIAVDGADVPKPRTESPSSADLLSAELDRFGRDPSFEDAVRAAAETSG